MKKFFLVFLTFLFSFLILLFPLSAYASDRFINVPAFNGLITETNISNAVMWKNTNDEYFLLCNSGSLDINKIFEADNAGYIQNHSSLCKLYKFVEGDSVWTLVYSLDGNANYVVSGAGYPISQQTFLYSINNFSVYDSTLAQVLLNYDTSSNAYNPSTGEVDITKIPGAGGGGEGEGGSYNDSSFKSLVSDLFDHLFNVLLYGEDEGYDGTDVDNSVQWLEDLADDMEDITVKLNQAPSYISNGFTAVSGAQTAINDFFTGISSAIPVIYYGIVGILNIIIIRKIIGR